MCSNMDFLWLRRSVQIYYHYMEPENAESCAVSLLGLSLSQSDIMNHGRDHVTHLVTQDAFQELCGILL